MRISGIIWPFYILIFMSMLSIHGNAQQWRDPGYGPGHGHEGRHKNPRRPQFPPPYSQPQIVCQAQDAGWEEHRAPHLSCGECLQQHGRCIETCEQIKVMSQCHVNGQSRNQAATPFIGEGQNQNEAYWNAMSMCESSGFRRCEFVQCRDVQTREFYSQNDCRPRRRW